MPLYEDLIRRAVEARNLAGSLHRDAARIRELAAILRGASQGHMSIRRCAWCERFEVAGEWLHLEAIGRGQQRIASSLLERASHGICDDCFDREMRRRR